MFYTADGKAEADTDGIAGGQAGKQRNQKRISGKILGAKKKNIGTFSS